MRDEIKRFWAALRQAQAARENPASAPCFAMTGEGRSAWLAAHYAGRPNTGGKPRELIEQSRDERDAAWLLQDQVDAAAAGHDDVTEVRPGYPRGAPGGRGDGPSMSHPLGTTRGRGSRRHPEPPIWTAELVRQHCFTLWARDPAGAQFPEPQDRPAVLVQIEIWRRVPAQRRGQRGRPGSSGFVETVEVVDFERPNPELPPPPEFSDEARRYAYVAAQLNARRVRVPAATDM